MEPTNQETKPSHQLETMVATLPETKAKVLLEKFNDYFDIASQWEAKLNTLVVTDESQVVEMRMAGEARKFLKKKRTEIEATRKEMKEDALREGNMIDGIAKVLKSLIEPLESKAQMIETFAERMAENRKKELYNTRLAILQAYEYVDVGLIKFGDMDEEQFEAHRNGVEIAYNVKKENERKAAEELKEKLRLTKLHNERKELLLPYWSMIPMDKRNLDFSTYNEADWDKIIAHYKDAKEKQDAENKRIQEENERLRKEQAETTRRTTMLKPYMSLVTDLGALISMSSEDLDKEMQRLIKERAEQYKKEQEEKNKAAASIPATPPPAVTPPPPATSNDKHRLLALIEQYKQIEMPTMTSAKGMQATVSIAELRNRFTNYIKQKADELSV